MTEKQTRDAPSIRKFDISKPNLDKRANDIELIHKLWTEKAMKDDSFDRNLSFFYRKILEEFEEFTDGEDETPTLIGSELQTTGDSRFSEAPTVILTILHWMRERTDLTYPQLLSMLEQRYREQAWRYHVIPTIDHPVDTNEESSFADGTYWLLRFSRDNRLFGVKVEWSSGKAKMREVVDMDTKYHWTDGKYTLPASYEPYMHVQHFTLLGDVRGVVWPDGLIVEFFGPRGVELISEPRDGKYIRVEDTEWLAPNLGTFRSMRHP